MAWRDRFPGGRWLDPRTLNHLEGQRSLAERARFYTTLYSGALNLSRSGAARLNLNAAVSDSLEPATVRAELDRIIAAIRHQLPLFGERFYRLGPDLNAREVEASHQMIYLEKLAANLRDYLDSDSQPTIVRADRSVALGVEPTEAIAPEGPPQQREEHGGDNPVLAVGKENVPYLQEFVCRVKLNRLTPAKKTTAVKSAEYDFYLDYYFEFWNLSARDITVADLGPDPFLRIDRQPALDTGEGTPIPEGRPIIIPLPPDLVFPAGRATVLTTDPSPPSSLLSRGPSAAAEGESSSQQAPWLVTLPVPESARRYTGTTTQVASSRFGVDLIARHTTRTDYGTQMILGNRLGLLESVAALPLVRGDSTGNNALAIHNDDEGDPERDTILNHEQFFLRGGSLRGNPGQSQTGDPRSNNEQLYLRLYAPEGDEEQTRFYQSELGDRNVPAESSLGAFNARYVDPASWSDPFAMSVTGANTPMVVADGPMRSIGELGHLYDPARGLGPTGEIAYSRGGGRTLAIGQPDPLWDGDPASPSRQWAAWRLCDIFSTGSAMELPGRINLNGVHRDGGVALRALLHGLEFTNGSQADPGLAGQRFERSATETVVAEISDRLLRDGPFLERGELSEAFAFRPGFAGAAAPHSLYDRGREELFRRVAELVTTRGNIFSVYAIGQAITQTPGGEKRVRATALLRVTFELVPEWNPPLDDAFDPTDEAAVAARFRKPDRFRVRVLQATL